MPRAASTWMLNVLAQNPSYHCTPTNNFGDMLRVVRDSWQNLEGFKAQGLFDVIKPRIHSMMREMVYGFYPELGAEDGPTTIFDKDRGWLNIIDLADIVNECETKIIVATRDPRDAFASFERKRKENPLGTPPIAKLATKAGHFEQTQMGRAQLMFGNTGVIGTWAIMFRDLLKSRIHQNRIVHVPYNDLIDSPKETIADIEEAIGLEPFDGYDFENVNQITEEDDNHHGWEGLHRVGPSARKRKKGSWTEVVSEDAAAWIAHNFPDLIKLVEAPEDAPKEVDARPGISKSPRRQKKKK